MRTFPKVKEVLHTSPDDFLDTDGDVQSFVNTENPYFEEPDQTVDVLQSDPPIGYDSVYAEPGVYVTFEDRLTALEALAKLYGQRNRAKGMDQALRVAPYRNDLSRRYENPDMLADAAAKKSVQLQKEIDKHMTTLTKEDELKAAGLGHDSSAISAGQTRQEIMDAFGEVVVYQDRQKNLRPLRKAAKIILNQ